MKHYLAYWKWEDWQARGAESAYHSSAAIMLSMNPDDQLWLFTRNKSRDTIQVVRRIDIQERKNMRGAEPWEYGVFGSGPSRQPTKSPNGDWLKVFDGVATIRGTHLKSKSAGKLAQRVQKPRQITADSADLLWNEWKKRNP